MTGVTLAPPASEPPADLRAALHRLGWKVHTFERHAEPITRCDNADCRAALSGDAGMYPANQHSGDRPSPCQHHNLANDGTFCLNCRQSLGDRPSPEADPTTPVLAVREIVPFLRSVTASRESLTPRDIDGIAAALASPAPSPEADPRDGDRPMLLAAERYAAEAILDRVNADPDDDAAIVARAALRLASPATPDGGSSSVTADRPTPAEPLDVERLADAMLHHFTRGTAAPPNNPRGVMQREWAAQDAAAIAAEYARLAPDSPSGIVASADAPTAQEAE